MAFQEFAAFINQSLYLLAFIGMIVTIGMTYFVYKKFQATQLKYLFILQIPYFLMFVLEMIMVVVTKFYSGPMLSYIHIIVFYAIYSPAVYIQMLCVHKIFGFEFTPFKKRFFLGMAISHALDCVRKIISGELFDRDWTVVVTTISIIYFLYLIYKNKHILKDQLAVTCYKIYFAVISLYIAWSITKTLAMKFFPQILYIFSIIDFYIFSEITSSVLIIILLADRYFKPISPKNETATIDTSVFSHFSFSNRETEVAHLIVQGFTAKEISEKMFISLQTVKNYTYRIYQKANVRSKIEFINVMNQTKEWDES